MIIRVLRFTPRKTLTYNNRWYEPVWPKHTLFFFPPDVTQFRIWLDFLCTEHKRDFLWLHTIILRVTRAQTRTLLYWKRNPVYEIMVRDRDYIKRINFHTQRIRKGIKKVPVILTRFGLPRR